MLYCSELSLKAQAVYFIRKQETFLLVQVEHSLSIGLTYLFLKNKIRFHRQTTYDITYVHYCCEKRHTCCEY